MRLVLVSRTSTEREGSSLISNVCLVRHRPHNGAALTPQLAPAPSKIDNVLAPVLLCWRKWFRNVVPVDLNKHTSCKLTQPSLSLPARKRSTGHFSALVHSCLRVGSFLVAKANAGARLPSCVHARLFVGGGRSQCACHGRCSEHKNYSGKSDRKESFRFRKFMNSTPPCWDLCRESENTGTHDLVRYLLLVSLQLQLPDC